MEFIFKTIFLIAMCLLIFGAGATAQIRYGKESKISSFNEELWVSQYPYTFACLIIIIIITVSAI